MAHRKRNAPSGSHLKNSRTPAEGAEGLQLTINWPWWLHPFWALSILAGGAAAFAIGLPPEAYATWGVPKFLDETKSLVLCIDIVGMVVGMTIGSGSAARGGTVTLMFSHGQLRWLRYLYQCVLFLTIAGYFFWLLSAVSQGVRFQDLANVLSRELGAIGDLKSSSRPIGGLSTFTQLGPLVVAIGFVLNRLGYIGKSFYVVILLSLIRVVFYAERLAFIEVAVPLLVMLALTANPKGRLGRYVRLGPILGVPLIWLLFAVSEYTRSWVFYETTASISFVEWVTLRLVGYYATSYNNSALIFDQLSGSGSVPYFSFYAFWNAPVLKDLIPHPGIGSLAPEAWWSSTLAGSSNPEFTNVGSFLVVSAELGIWLGLGIWLIAGVLAGYAFGAMTRGSVPALLVCATLFIGIVELPRFVYWSLGRAAPLLIVLFLIILFFPGDNKLPSMRQKRPG